MDISIDHISNTLIFDLECDRCEFDSIALYNNCECLQNCQDGALHLLTALQEIRDDLFLDFQDCMDICQEDYGEYAYDYNLLVQCQNQCETNYDIDLANVTCEDYCGDFETSLFGARFGFSYSLWWTTDLIETGTGPPDEFYISPIILGRPGRYEHVFVSQDFMNQPISYCILYSITVQYNDASCCVYEGYECVQRG